MTTERVPSRIEELLAHRAWVRALARRLVADENRADDLEQETWTRAIEHPPRHGGSVRAWLGRVLRNVWIDAHRSESQRALRELASARPEAAARPADVVAEADAHRRVVQAAYDLDEPYRTTLLLRYFDGLGVRAIAQRMDVAPDTVKTRLRRGIERMRARLDAESSGRREDWRVALVPLALGTGGVAVKTTTKAAVAAAVLLAVGTGTVWWTALPRADEGSGAGVSDTAPPPVAAEAPKKRAAKDPERAAADTEPFPGTATLSGEVRTRADAAPAAGATVLLTDRAGSVARTVTADDTGRFSFASIAPSVGLHLSAETKAASAVTRRVTPLADREVRDAGILWLDAFGELEVTVETTQGSPEGAEVEVYPTSTVIWGAISMWTEDDDMRRGDPPLAAGRADASGRTRLRVRSGGVSLIVRKAGFVPRSESWFEVLPGVTTTRRVLLETGVSLEGRIVDGAHRPLPARRVVARSQDAMLDASGLASFSTAASDADGRFRLDGLVAGPVTVQLRTDAGVTPLATVRAPSAGVIDFVVEMRTVEGTVTRIDDGTPVAGADVRALLSSSTRQATLHTRADEAGRYRLEIAVDGGVSGLHAEAPGLAPASAMSATDSFTTKAGETVRRDLQVAPSASVSGVVTLAGKPVPGAGIRAYWWDGVSIHVRETMTDASGRYVAGELPPARLVVVQVIARGLTQDPWDPQGYVSVLMGRGEGSPGWSLTTNAEAPARLDITMVAGRTVAGRIEDEAGAPVAGATVFGGAERTVSGPDGRFRLAGIPAAGNTSLGVSAEGFVHAMAPVPAQGDIADLKVVLQRAARIRGTVRMDGGAPAPAGTVVRMVSVESLQWYPDESTAWKSAAPIRVSGDGSFETAFAIAAGAVQVRAEAPGFAQLPVTVTVAPGAREVTVALVLAAAPRLEGRVVDDATDAPIEGAKILVDFAGVPRGMPRSVRTPVQVAVTGTDGAFSVADIPPGAYPVKVTAAGHVTRSMNVTLPSAAPLVVRLPASVLLFTGVVLGPDRRPVAGASVSARPEPVSYAPSEVETPWTNTGADGRFELRGASGAATWTVMVHPPAGKGFPGRWTKLDGVAQGRADLEFVLGASRRIAGRVLASDGTPLRNVDVRTSCREPNAAQPTARTDERGTFVLEGVDDGRRYDLRVQAPAEKHGELFVAVGRDLNTTLSGVAAGDEDVTIRLDPGETISGTLSGDDGRPLAGVWLCVLLQRGKGYDEARARQAEGGHPGAQTDSAGAFRIRGVATARCRVVRVDGGSGSPTWTPLTGGEDVAAGASGLLLRVPTLGVIEGRVVDEEGNAVADARVVATAGTSARVGSAETAADGVFRLDRLDVTRQHAVAVSKAGVFVEEHVDGLRAGAKDVVIRLRRGLRSTGRIIDPDGKPVGRQCILAFVAESDGSEFVIRTEADGRFDVAGLAEGVYRVEARVVQTSSGKVLHGSATLRAGEQDVDLRFSE